MPDKHVDPAASSSARQTIGRLLRELYDEPQEFSPQLRALIAKLKEDDSTITDVNPSRPIAGSS